MCQWRESRKFQRIVLLYLLKFLPSPNWLFHWGISSLLVFWTLPLPKWWYSSFAALYQLSIFYNAFQKYKCFKHQHVIKRTRYFNMVSTQLYLATSLRHSNSSSVVVVFHLSVKKAYSSNTALHTYTCCNFYSRSFILFTSFSLLFVPT